MEQSDLPIENMASKALRTENMRITAENVELLRSNSALQDFANTASHDLQSPLRGNRSRCAIP